MRIDQALTIALAAAAVAGCDGSGTRSPGVGQVGGAAFAEARGPALQAGGTAPETRPGSLWGGQFVRCRSDADCREALGDAGGACLERVCDRATLTCAQAPVTDGAPCDDGDVCTHGDACLAGQCGPGDEVPCDDDDACTDDLCDPAWGCWHAPIEGCVLGASCGDGLCQGMAGETCASCPVDCGPCLGGDCCAQHDAPGCEDGAVTACVCDSDPYCCAAAWDVECVGVAIGCGAECGEAACGDGLCDADLGEGCEACPDDCPCVAVCGDGACSGSETCGTCEADCGPCVGECCVDNGSPGCETPELQGCVCDLDAYCCEDTWDDFCAETASAECGACAEPACGDGECDDDEGCEACPDDCGLCAEPVPASCCEARPAPGCDDEATAACVCALDPYCCSFAWDAICVEEAAGCGAPCVPDGCGDGQCAGGESCATCPGDCGACGVGDCCAPHASPGCAIPVVQACVCADDPFCCSTGWDALCVKLAGGCGTHCAAHPT